MSVIKSWVYMSNAAKDWHDRLQSQLLVQSVFLHWQGREFSETGAKILSNNRLLWPQNIKASTNQCRFAQRFSSEIFFCLPEKDHLDANTQQLLIERAWMDTYKSFGWKEKNWLLRSFVDSARAPHDLEKSTEEQNLKSMMSFLLGKLQKKKEFQESSWGPRFLAELTQKFDRIGVGEVFEPTEFDFVFLFDEEIKPGSSFISSFQNFFQKNKGDRVALLDQKQMFLTESGVSYPRRSLKKWKSKTLIWTTCAPPSFRAINSLIPHSDQLLLIQDCSKSEDLSWKSLFHEGIGAFAKSNPKVSFIQFHLPSLSLRRLELESVGNVFKSFSETRLSRLSQIFGWQKVEWKKEIQAYTPKAYIDAIPLFRWPLAQEI